MIIDRETFTDLAIHLKLASDALLTTARHLAVLSNDNSGPEEHWTGTLDSLMSVNSEITVMERILRALMDANRRVRTHSTAMLATGKIAPAHNAGTVATP